ncbi:polysaccharide deacetylase family protein [Psychroflexus salis]|uniref:Polysaccharide deacetylase n=1 Tax=Psychroflexus salis TaxID=1526574 RepID=A0A916ZLK1_9FLAO|nr:polysaccharide deacetylase family protein [Psychroflexus salis]GGE03255.1 polysaccharide deacetylase [Psychroflexus salis]
MEIVPHQTPLWLKQLYPKRIWSFETTKQKEKTIYLTFDDGPIPKITPWVLATLQKYNAQASFFCIGENLQKHSKIAQQVIAAGHSLGNHTQHHVSGWKIGFNKYIEDFELAQKEFEKQDFETKLFRPPYGKITTKQASFLLQKKIKIIMWDVLTKDYAKHLNPKELLEKSILATSSGSIVVFHDSEKAYRNLQYILPKYLAHFSKLGYQFKAI